MKIINCKVCDEEFDVDSKEKKKLVGLYSSCPECSEETAIKYAGVQSADGKQAQATILKFTSNEDRSAYISFWQNNSGQNKRKKLSVADHTYQLLLI